MRNLLFVFIVSFILAYQSQYFGYNHELVAGERKRMNIYIIAMIILMVLFVGLRTGYNDTAAYIRGFTESENIRVFLADSENFYPLHNPLFYGIQALVRSFTGNYHIFFMLWAMVDIPLLVHFILTYTDGEDFAIAIFIFFALGTFVFGMAALKQISGMAILTFSIPYLLDKKYGRYTLIVLIAGLIHTYAFLFLILPFFRSKPWGFQSLLLIAFTIAVLVTFNDTISSLLEYADSIGKTVAEEEVFDGNGMSIFRIAVFAVCPCVILVFRSRLLSKMKPAHELLSNMTIISFMVMLLASQNGANMFGRIATYFEIGNACMIPWVLRNLFNERSYKLTTFLAMAFFMGFFMYDNAGFSTDYSSITILGFFADLL